MPSDEHVAGERSERMLEGSRAKRWQQQTSLKKTQEWD